MIGSKVLPERELKDRLKELGLEPTDEKTNTGTFWKDTATGKHFLVPESVQGFYPNWLLEDLEEHIGTIKIPPGP